MKGTARGRFRSGARGMIMKTTISWMFLVYFVVLFAERTQSLIRVFTVGLSDAFASRFDIYVNMISVASLVATLVLLIGFNGGFWRSLGGGEVVPNYSRLCIAAGVILVSGMMHTEFTIAPIQFAAYGALIVAMILRTVQEAGGADSRVKLWYSLVFLAVFSMAIPVVYRSTELSYSAVFHATEGATALLLVMCFTYMLRMMFTGKGEDLLLIVPFIIMLVGDAAIIAMGWKEGINWFLLIFSSLSVLLFAAGKIVFHVVGKK